VSLALFETEEYTVLLSLMHMQMH